MTALILGMAASYSLVGALLVWIVVAARLHFVFKAGVVLLFAAAVPFTYHGIGELRGLPSDSPPPPSFIMHWARVVEPNPLTGDPGHVFIWLEALDDENFPSGTPRAYQLPYEDGLVQRVEAAMGKIAGGEEIAGSIDQEADIEESTAEELADELQDAADNSRPESSTIGDRGYAFDPSDLTFGPAPAPITPEKPGG